MYILLSLCESFVKHKFLCKMDHSFRIFQVCLEQGEIYVRFSGTFSSFTHKEEDDSRQKPT